MTPTTQMIARRRGLGMGGGLVGATRRHLVQRAAEWERQARAAEACLADWRARGECAQTIGAPARAAEFADRVRKMADAYHEEVAKRSAPGVATAPVDGSVEPLLADTRTEAIAA